LIYSRYASADVDMGKLSNKMFLAMSHFPHRPPTRNTD
jgi:hypothetical protein